jgi:hypothetical protein
MLHVFDFVSHVTIQAGSEVRVRETAVGETSVGEGDIGVLVGVARIVVDIAVGYDMYVGYGVCGEGNLGEHALMDSNVTASKMT